MGDLLVLLVHLVVTLARLAGPGGLRSVVAESVLVRHQLLVLRRGRKRAPNVRAADRIIIGLRTLLIRPSRVFRSAIVLMPAATLLHFHTLLKKRKYRICSRPNLAIARARRDRAKTSSMQVGNAATLTRLSPNCSTDRAGVRHCGRQGSGSAHPERSLPATTRIGRSFLAYLPRSR